MELIKHLDASTLGELRALVAATSDLPDPAPVLVRTRFAWGAREGLPVTRVHIGEAREDTTTRTGEEVQ